MLNRARQRSHLKAGRRAIALQLEELQEQGPQWYQGDRITGAGSRAYRQDQQRLRAKGVPDPVEVSFTRRALLRQAGMSTAYAANYRALDTYLDRWAHAVGCMGPLLHSVRQVGRRLKFSVSAEWLSDDISYVKVALPLPIVSVTVQRMHFYMATLNLSESNRVSTKLEVVGKRLGLGARARQALRRAIRALNKHETKVQAQARIIWGFTVIRHHVDCSPEPYLRWLAQGRHFRMVAAGRGQVRFVATEKVYRVRLQREVLEAREEELLDEWEEQERRYEQREQKLRDEWEERLLIKASSSDD